MNTKNTVTLPAVEVTVPRMGNVVYVSERVGIQDGKPTCMFSAEISVSGSVEIQSFHLKCKTKKEAESTIDVYQKRLKNGPFMFIQHSF